MIKYTFPICPLCSFLTYVKMCYQDETLEPTPCEKHKEEWDYEIEECRRMQKILDSVWHDGETKDEN